MTITYHEHQIQTMLSMLIQSRLDRWLVVTLTHIVDEEYLAAPAPPRLKSASMILDLKNAGYSQSEIASILSVSRQYVSAMLLKHK